MSTQNVPWYRRFAKLIGLSVVGAVIVGTALGVVTQVMPRMAWATGFAVEMGMVMGFAVSLVGMGLLSVSRRKSLRKNQGVSAQSTPSRP